MKAAAGPSALAWLEDLNPRYFALTMATGIVAIGLRMHGYAGQAQILSVLALCSWGVLFGLYTWRLCQFPLAVIENLHNPRTCFAFFTFVAATAVCGLLLLEWGYTTLAIGAWLVAFGYWSVLMYFSFASLGFSHPDRPVSIMDGGWLVLIVAIQSLVLLGTAIAPSLGDYTALMMVEVTLLWCLGMVFYGILVTLFCYRIFFLQTAPGDFGPLMWVIMGASAISANAGSGLLIAEPAMPVLAELRPAVLLAVIVWWTWATWWIPMLVAIGLWKHAWLKLPLRYEVGLWSLVFPLGMYAVSTRQLVLAAQFTPLTHLSHLMTLVALLAWSVTAAALSSRLWDSARRAGVFRTP